MAETLNGEVDITAWAVGKVEDIFSEHNTSIIVAHFVVFIITLG